MQQPTSTRVMPVHIDTRAFFASHLREPKGRGWWMFQIGAEQFSAKMTGSDMPTYAEAKAQATARARELGVTTVQVLS